VFLPSSSYLVYTLYSFHFIYDFVYWAVFYFHFDNEYFPHSSNMCISFTDIITASHKLICTELCSKERDVYRDHLCFSDLLQHSKDLRVQPHSMLIFSISSKRSNSCQHFIDQNTWTPPVNLLQQFKLGKTTLNGHLNFFIISHIFTRISRNMVFVAREKWVVSFLSAILYGCLKHSFLVPLVDIDTSLTPS
jgi:hypothetical protein